MRWFSFHSLRYVNVKCSNLSLSQHVAMKFENLVILLQGVPKRKRYGAHPRFIQGEEVEQQQRLDLSQVSDMGMVKEQQKRGLHATGPSSSRRNDAVPSGKPSVRHEVI